MPQSNFSVDLHVHTNASDGALSPAQILEEAQWHGVSAVAITDHDTVSGLPAALAAGRERNIEVIPGVELSCRYENTEVHLVGLLIEPDAKFIALLEHLRRCRETRMDKMLANLRSIFNINVDKSELDVLPGTAFGRPHLARALVAKGIVRNTSEAFDRFLGDNGPVYVEREHLSVADGIAMLHRIHGVSILAHPGVSGITDNLDVFREMGVMGMETHYPQYSPAMEKKLSAYCGDWGLLQSGGSDFHSNERGGSLGAPHVPYEFLLQMKKKKEQLWPGSSADSKTV